MTEPVESYGNAAAVSDAFYKSLAAHSSDMVSRCTRQAEYVYVSPSCAALVGWTPQELVGRDGHGFAHPDDRDRVHALLLAVDETSGVSTVTYRFRRKSGRYIWVESTMTAVQDDSGVACGVQLATRDATVRCEAEQRLRQSESLYRTLTANLPDTSIFMFDRDLRILIAEGEGVRRLSWIDASMFRGRKVADLQGELPSEILEMSLESYQAALDGKRREFEFTSDGHSYMVIAVPVHDRDGEVESAIAVVRNITKRREAEADRSRLAAVVASSEDAILAKDVDGLITDWNAAAERMYGYGAEEVLGKPVSILVPPDRRDQDAEVLRRILAGERIEHFETERLRRDGSRVPVSLTLSAVRDNGGMVVGASSIARDITDRRAAETDRSRLAALVDHSPDAIVAVNRALLITAFNPAAADLYALRREEVVGKPVGILLGSAEREDDWLAPLRSALAGDRVTNERLLTRADGSTLALAVTVAPIGARGAIVGAVAIVRDVTSQWSARVALEHDGRRTRILAEASRALGSSLQATHAVSVMTQLVVPELGELCAVVAAGENGGPRLIAVNALDPDVGELVHQALADDPLSDADHETENPELAHGEDILLDPVTPEMVASWAARFPHMGDGFAKLGVVSAMIVPLRLGVKTSGVAFVASLRPERHFTSDDLALVGELAGRVSQALENARLFASAQSAQDQAELAVKGLALAEQRFSAAFANAPIGMALLSLSEGERSRIDDVNPALCELTGFTHGDLKGADLVETLVHPGERDPARQEIKWVLSGSLSAAVAERHYVRSSGDDVWVQTSVARLGNGFGGGQLVLQVQDITERKLYEDQLRHLADHDPLTGLFNRRRFVEELDREVANAHRHRISIAVLMIDVDHFKSANDTYGHAVGDEVLAAVAHTFAVRVRDTDIVGRLGGDEFGVVLTHTDVHAAKAVAVALLEALHRREVFVGNDQPVSVTASIGIRVLEPGETLTADELIVEADIALYEAKEGGRNRVSTGGRNNAESTRMRRRLAMADRIRRALDSDDGFVLYEQPIRSLHNGQIERAEILVRMPDGNGDVLSPSAFLPVADRFDLMPTLDQWVISRSIELLAQRQAAGIQLGMEVNLSATSIGDADVVDFIAASVRNAQINPTLLTFEVTETEAIVNIDRARVLSRQLSSLGCQFALDDFGAGFGSFYYLKHLPFDLVKIDGDFIKAVLTNKTDQLTVEAIVSITRGLGKKTVAEFVADERTTNMLRAYGVDFAQGFHIGKPRLAVTNSRYAPAKEF